MAWIPALAALGFQAYVFLMLSRDYLRADRLTRLGNRVSISAWSKDVRVYSAGVDIGGITELKGLYG